MMGDQDRKTKLIGRNSRASPKSMMALSGVMGKIQDAAKVNKTKRQMTE